LSDHGTLGVREERGKAGGGEKGRDYPIETEKGWGRRFGTISLSSEGVDAAVGWHGARKGGENSSWDLLVSSLVWRVIGGHVKNNKT